MRHSAVLPIEIGSLSASSPEDSQFIGSSSGVFFVNTVYRAFAKSKNGERPDIPVSDTEPDPETVDQDAVDQSIAADTISGRSDRDPPFSGNQADGENSLTYGLTLEGHGLGRPPSRDLGQQLIVTYFQTWHSLFPFLLGRTFLQEVDSFYAGNDMSLGPTVTLGQHKQTCRAIIFQSVFNIAALDRVDLHLPSGCRIGSSAAIVSLIGVLASKHDLLTLQALMAAQLYLIATLALHAASTIGGILIRSLFHAGYHRCPNRYSQLSQQDCDIRKRVFWSAYIADRHLSQALGIPLGIQDSDVDVCVPGMEEMHCTVGHSLKSSTATEPNDEVLAHLPQRHPDFRRPSDSHLQSPRDTSTASLVSPGKKDTSSGDNAIAQGHPGEGVFASYIEYCRITGRAMELFHKSLSSRVVGRSDILMLNSEVNEWWNSLPQAFQDLPDDCTTNICANYSAFFNIIYQQLILLINRPFLSLNPVTPEFRSSLQTCVGVSRLIIRGLQDRKHGQQRFSWPGVLSSVWMAGLVLAFACELKLYPFSKGMR